MSSGTDKQIEPIEGIENVAVAWGPTAYDAEPPFSPGRDLPEYPFARPKRPSAANEVYLAVREALRLLGLDESRFGSRQWNPLRDLVRPGETVVLKPNFVRDFRETRPGHDDCLITHGSVIRAVLDYVYIALGGQGRIVIADAPQDDADFEAIQRIAGLGQIQQFYRREAGFDVEVRDLRPAWTPTVDGLIVARHPLPGDPAGYLEVDLAADSAFGDVGHLCHLLYGSEHDTQELRSHHHDNVHEYLMSGTVLEADCVINLPKLKTHKKTGVTLGMKNLVGVSGHKNWLPHHRQGGPASGGDQFADDRFRHRVERVVVERFKRLFPLLGPLRSALAGFVKGIGRGLFGDTHTDTIRSGNWYGNDTTWRMVLDLNRILAYADGRGRLRDRPARRGFTLVDGIVAGEGNGPLDPVPKPCGAVVAGANTVAVDLTCTRLMGFDWRKIPLLREAIGPHRYRLIDAGPSQIRCLSNRAGFDRMLSQLNGQVLAFVPHFGWRGHIEIRESLDEAGVVTQEPVG